MVNLLDVTDEVALKEANLNVLLSRQLNKSILKKLTYMDSRPDELEEEHGTSSEIQSKFRSNHNLSKAELVKQLTQIQSNLNIMKL